MKHEGSRPPADSSVLVHAVADTEAMQSPAEVLVFRGEGCEFGEGGIKVGVRVRDGDGWLRRSWVRGLE